MSRETRKCFYDEYLDDFYEYIEIQKIEELKNDPKYVELHNKIVSIKQNNAKIRNFIENNKVDTMSADEMAKLLDLIKANDNINILCEGVIFKLGFKEACTIII